MELNWSTFILEIINFLVLIWILKHFFYSPIQKAISSRKKMVDEKLESAEMLQTEGKELQKKYENRLQEWGKEKEQKQKLFIQELEEWKSQEHVKFLKTLDGEKEKLIAREMQNITKIIKKNGRDSMLIAGQFASRFLKEFADENLDNKIIDKVIDKLKNPSEENLQLLKNGFQTENKVEIQSAYVLNENYKNQLKEKIQQIINKNIKINFTVNPDLLAGITIQIGSVFLKANLRDELKFFTEVESAIA